MRRAGVIIAIVAIALLAWILCPRSPAASCERLLQARTSPKGAWVAEHYLETCSDEGSEQFALRAPQAKPLSGTSVIINAAGEDRWAENLLFKWLSDNELLVAIPADRQLPGWAHAFQAPIPPAVFNGVQLDYATYSNDPDRVHDPAAFQSIERPTAFGAIFEFLPHAVGLAGATCNLYLRATDRADSDRLSIRISMTRTDATRAWTPSGQTITVPARTDISLLVDGGQSGVASAGDVTAAAFDTMPRSNERGALIRSFLTVKAPSGVLVPAWQIMWSLDRASLDAIVRKLRSGQFSIRLGFWLDNREELDANTAALDPAALDHFETCVRENAALPPAP